MVRRQSTGRKLVMGLLGLVATSTLLGPSVHAQTDAAGGLGGYEGQAHSSGLHVFYNPEGLLPTAAPVDLGSPDALATISTGPTTFGRASVADPGDLLVNPDALLSQADPSYPQGTIPAYPYRISATSGFGEPTAESRPAPGLEASVEALPDGSSARASSPAMRAPGVATVGSMASAATTTFDGSTVTVRARTEVSAFDLLGLLKIDSIVTEVTATSSGDGTEVSGGTTISGATLADQPVTIDSEGIHMEDGEGGGQSIPILGQASGGALGDLPQALADAGIRVSLPGPIEAGGDESGELGSTGLRIDIEVSDDTFPILGQVASQLPPLENPIPGAPGVEDLLAFAQARHLTAMEVGRATVSLTARPAFEAPPFDAPDTGFAAGPAGTPSSPGTVSSPAATPATRPPATPAAPPAAVPSGPPLSQETPIASLGAGIGALALLALLAQPFIGDRVARAAAAVLATSPADTCPLEKP